MLNKPFHLAVRRFNADASLDVALAMGQNNQVRVLPGNGDGTFGAAIVTATTGFPIALVAGDFTGHGLTDLATANFSGNNLTLMPGNGTGGF